MSDDCVVVPTLEGKIRLTAPIRSESQMLDSPHELDLRDRFGIPHELPFVFCWSAMRVSGNIDAQLVILCGEKILERASLWLAASRWGKGDGPPWHSGLAGVRYTLNSDPDALICVEVMVGGKP